jgi:hypothetical protein
MSTETIHLRLQTEAGVDQAIVTLTDAARSLAGLVAPETLNAIEREREALVALKQQLQSGDYIVVDPDLSGWRFQTCHFLPETGLKEYVRGHDRIVSVAALALQLGQPVVVGSEHPEAWREQVARRLRTAGVVAITEMSGRD